MGYTLPEPLCGVSKMPCLFRSPQIEAPSVCEGLEVRRSFKYTEQPDEACYVYACAYLVVYMWDWTLCTIFNPCVRGLDEVRNGERHNLSKLVAS